MPLQTGRNGAHCNYSFRSGRTGPTGQQFMSNSSSNPLAPARAIALAEHVLREKLDKWTDLKKHEQLFRLILARTQGEEKAELKDLLPEPDERTIRRWIGHLNSVLRAGFANAGCIYALQVVEGQPGHQSESQKKDRNTFTIVANADLQNASYRKCWTGLYANSLNAKAYPATFVYPLYGGSERALGLGCVQMLKHLSRSFLLNGVDLEDADCATFHCEDLREPGRNLILIGGPDENPHVADLQIPDELELEWDRDTLSISGGKDEHGNPVPPPTDTQGAGPRAVHVLATCMPPAWMDDARIWIFQALEDRAYEAMGLFFSSNENLETLAVKLGVRPSEEFPARMQLVFRVHIKANGQLRNGTGDVQLISFFGAARGSGPPSQPPPMVPRRPNNLEGGRKQGLHIAASGGSSFGT